jgi:hypothetical protein
LPRGAYENSRILEFSSHERFSIGDQETLPLKVIPPPKVLPEYRAVGHPHRGGKKRAAKNAFP